MSAPLGPVWNDLFPGPLVIQVLGVTRAQHEGPGLGVDSQTLVVLRVHHLPLGLVKAPGPLDHPHLTPGDGHPVRTLCLDTPLPIGQLTLSQGA